MKGQDRIVEIDIAKGIGILFVIFGHILPKGNCFREFIYTFHMPLFFFLSGMVIKTDNREEKCGECNLIELLKKERKLTVSYYFYSVIFLLYDFFVRYILLKKVGISFLLKNIYQTIVLYGIDVLWFLASLLIGKIIARYFIRKIGKNYKMFFISLTFMIIPTLIWNTNWKICNDNLFSYFIYFPINTVFRTTVVTGFIIMGALLTVQIRKLLSCKIVYFLPTLLIVNLIYIVADGSSIDYHSMVIGKSGMFVILAFTGILGILGVSSILKSNKIIRQSLVYCSNVSLFLMITHNYFQIIALLRIFLHTVWPSSNENIILFLECILVLIIELLLCLTIKPFFDICIEKIMNLLKVLKGSDFSG